MLIQAVERLSLPMEAKIRLVDIVRDPPGGSYLRVTEEGVSVGVVDALVNMEIDSGLSREKAVYKVLRLAPWALVYYPGQEIPSFRAVQWFSPDRVQENSQAVDTFQRNVLSKVAAMIRDLKIPNVSLVTTRKRSAPNTVKGFRLTFDGDDYLTRVVSRANDKVGKSIKQFIEAVSPDRILPEHLKDTSAQRVLTEAQEQRGAIMEGRLLEGFSPMKERLLSTGSQQR